MPSFNFSDIVTAAGDADELAFEPGTYRMRVESAKWGVTSTEKDKLVLALRCTDGPKEGTYHTWNMVISPDSPKALAFFLSRMAELGCSSEFLNSNPAPDAVLARLVGPQEYLVTLKKSFWNGRAQLDVSGIKKL